MTQPAIYLCGYDDGRRVTPNPDCPSADLHTPSPPGYLPWQEWAEGMAETHQQRQCGGCGLWLIWVLVAEGAHHAPNLGATEEEETGA